jgi:hypothetical protein
MIVALQSGRHSKAFSHTLYSTQYFTPQVQYSNDRLYYVLINVIKYIVVYSSGHLIQCSEHSKDDRTASA